jgi:hypothetical protein
MKKKLGLRPRRSTEVDVECLCEQDNINIAGQRWQITNESLEPKMEEAQNGVSGAQ